jgi:hypothetical protein
MLPLILPAPLKAGEEELGAAPVLLTRGVEVATPEEEPTEVDPVEVVPGGGATTEELPVSTAEEDSEVSVGLAVVVGAAVLLSSPPSLLMGGMEMGWPADLHWLVTALETAGYMG